MRRLSFLLVLALAAPLPGCAQEAAESGINPEGAFQTGAYEAAADGFESLARQGGGNPRAGRMWARSLAAVGEYEAGLDALETAASASGGAASVEFDRVRGMLLRAVGRNEEAESALRRAVEGASDAQLARLELGLLLSDKGENDEATDLFDGFIDFYNASTRLDAEHLLAVGIALTELGARDHLLYEDAVRAFEEARAADPGDPEPSMWLGQLFLDKYNSGDAGPLIDEALARNPSHPGALLAKARRANFDGSREAIELAELSLETNPRFVPARALLARLYLELDEVDRAEEEARRALETNPSSLEAWTELAAAAHWRGDQAAFRDARDRVLAIDPVHDELYVALAEVAYRTHRYQDAVAFAGQAVDLDPTSWAASAALGLNQLRVGDIAGARATLETTFEGDPYNVWVFNTLGLLDELEKFERAETDNFVFYIHPDEFGVLSAYSSALAEEAFAAMEARYGYRPPTPISVEIYDRDQDFSVRTVGLAGIGALGVSFGSVLAMDSPSARTGGEFNWGSTLWHEISHAFTLGYTDHRVPRWLSEGLAVLDERHARDGWGSDVDPGFLAAFEEDRLPSLERFNYGFVRPAYPGQVQHSYYMASLLCEMIEETRGFGAIRAMLDGYRDGLETDEIVQVALGTDLAGLDRELHAYLETRFADAIASLGPTDSQGPPPADSFGGLLASAAAAEAAGSTAEAISDLEQARQLFPEYVGPDAPALILGRLYRTEGDFERAAEVLRDYTVRNENHFDARIALADVAGELGDAALERQALGEAIWVDPFDADVHERLAASYEEASMWTEAALERRALVGLRPTDMAAAHYELARALHRAGDRSGARGAVLDALEIAPNYEAALDLLLEISGGTR